MAWLKTIKGTFKFWSERPINPYQVAGVDTKPFPKIISRQKADMKYAQRQQKRRLIIK